MTDVKVPQGARLFVRDERGAHSDATLSDLASALRGLLQVERRSVLEQLPELDPLRNYRVAAEALWQLLDDIDSLGEAMRPEITEYFMAVSARTTRRHHWLETDGYGLVLKERK